MKHIPVSEKRSRKELIEHYELEKKLANRLRNSNKEERKHLYKELYDELFGKISYFSRRKHDPESRHKSVLKQMDFITRFMSPDKTFMEIGAGDCALSIELCKYFKNVYAIDVSNQIRKDIDVPGNFRFALSDGTAIDVPPESIDITYSNQVMEHLHPADAYEQLKNIYHALASKGLYIIFTPHRFTGPHDISKYFDDIATGFHLNEYTNTELHVLLRSIGFSKINYFTQLRGKRINLPILPTLMIERLMTPLPRYLKKKIFRKVVFRHLLPIRIVATK